MLDGYPVDINRQLVNPIGHEHERVMCEVIVGDDMGFVWNKQSQCYELITERQTWSHEIPIERFLEKITQLYCIQLLTSVAKSNGFEVESQKVNSSNAVELVVNRWV